MRYRFFLAPWHADARARPRILRRKDATGGRVPAPDGERGVYGISVAAELVGMGVQNLRLYEARGLLEPERTAGAPAATAPNDLDRLRRIGDLLDAGLNLAGIGMVLDLEGQNARLRDKREAPPCPQP